MRTACGGQCPRARTRPRNSTGWLRTFTSTRMLHLHRAERGRAGRTEATSTIVWTHTRHTFRPTRWTCMRRLLVLVSTAILGALWVLGGCPIQQPLRKCGLMHILDAFKARGAFGPKPRGDGSCVLYSGTSSSGCAHTRVRTTKLHALTRARTLSFTRARIVHVRTTKLHALSFTRARIVHVRSVLSRKHSRARKRCLHHSPLRVRQRWQTFRMLIPEQRREARL